ncbi:MAG: T9SS type A sorting domain-containing protein [Ignavibacteriaceae bacterium]|nr:T9SS type A sorting domain-containing protein [Ignavibacteriaceae bacterium]
MIDPCTFPYGDVRGGINCADVNPFFWLSGDPVTNIGWINNSPIDQRQMQNIGPFELEAGEEYNVFVAYSVGQGTNALSSITEGRSVAEISNILYGCNFLTNCVVSVEDDFISQPSDFILNQNYPNPFNPSTKISWQSPVASWQTIKIYDVLGNEVATLVDEYKPAGSYEVEWDAINYPSGVYFYRLQAGSLVETKKLILMK